MLISLFTFRHQSRNEILTTPTTNNSSSSYANVFKIILFNFEQQKIVKNKKKKKKKKKKNNTTYNHKATFAVIMMGRDNTPPFLLEYQHIRAGTSSPKLFPTQIKSVEFLPLIDASDENNTSFTVMMAPLIGMVVFLFFYFSYMFHSKLKRRYSLSVNWEKKNHQPTISTHRINNKEFQKRIFLLLLIKIHF